MSGAKYVAIVSAGVVAGSVLAHCLRRCSLKRSHIESPTRHAPSAAQTRIIEASLSDIGSAMAAWEGGATSIELCADRGDGGVTPSIGLVRECVRRLGSLLEIHVLIRPRVGDFVYSHDDFDVMLQDVIECKKCGAAGVVVGVLTRDGHIDVPRMKVLREVSSSMILTFHRAYDVCTQDAETSLQLLGEIGCDRLLTSGRAESAVLGEPHLQRLANSRFRGNIAIIAAAGVNSKNAKSIVTNTSVQGVHAGSAVHSTKETLRDGKLAEFASWQSVSSDSVNELVVSANRGWKHSR